MSNARILFVDDDLELHKLVRVLLNDTEWEVLFACSGHDALEIFNSTWVDLVLLDVMMPEMDGFEVCRRIRVDSNVPIIFLTARNMEQDVVSGLEQGADDYISKPFRPNELRARIRSKLRTNSEAKHEEVIRYENISLYLKSHLVLCCEKPIEISPLEYRLLRLLMQRAGVAVSKEDLLKSVWGFRETTGANDINLVEAAVRRLRKKIEMDPANPSFIQTVWGIGYRFGKK